MINPIIWVQNSIMFKTLRVCLFGDEIRWMKNKREKIGDKLF